MVASALGVMTKVMNGLSGSRSDVAGVPAAVAVRARPPRPVHPDHGLVPDGHQDRFPDGRRGRCHLAHAARVRTTGAKMVAELELPAEWNFLALMPAKNSATFTLVFVTVVNYVIYNRAIRQGTIVWGKIDFASQFVLIFLAFSIDLDDGLDGCCPLAAAGSTTTRTICCRTSPRSRSRRRCPYSAWWITGITVVFFAVVSFAMIVTLRPSDSKGHAPKGVLFLPEPSKRGRTLLRERGLYGECH